MSKLVTLWGGGAVAVLGFVASMLPASATAILGVNYPSAPGSSLCSATSCVGGYEFTVNSTILVTALGTFDGGQGNPSNGGALSDLSTAETVDLFNSLGSVIATTTVGDGVGTQVGTWWAFNNLTSAQTLSPGTYYVAALLNSDDNASFPAPAPTVGADITFDEFVYCNSNVGNPQNNPTNTSNGCALNTSDFLTSTNTSQGFLGGNIEYTDPPAAVPEPSSLAILGAALFGLGFVGFRRQRKDAA